MDRKSAFWRSFLAILALAGIFVGSVKSKDTGGTWNCESRQVLTPFHINDDKQETDLARKHYKIEYTDLEEKKFFVNKFQNGLFDYRNFFDGIDLKISERIGNKNIVVNKCCSKHSYFDLVNYNCVPPGEKLDGPDSAGSISNQTISKYLFVESVPNCGTDSVLSVIIASKVQVEGNGVRVNGEVYSKYCLDESPKYPNQTLVLACQDSKTFCNKNPCFRKCCPLKQSYEEFGRKCQTTNNPFTPEFFKFPELTLNSKINLSEFGIYMGDACEKRGKYLLEKNEGELSYLDSTGALYVPMYKKCFSRDEFCIEHVKLDNYSEIGSFLCFTQGSSHFENSRLQYILLSLGLIISSMFLLLTFLAYLFSPNLHNLYGKTLMCYIACLFTAYLSLAIVGLKSTELSKTLCICMGYVILFSFLAAFFWLNVISFDVWKAFRKVRSLDTPKNQKSKNLKFAWYSLYAWAFPSVITASCSVAEMPNFPFEALRPDFGVENCWFSRQKYGIYVFFVAPISFLIVCNIVFYIQTAWRIWRVRTDIAKMGRQKRKKFTANKDQFLINGKLFIVMGITWSLEIISSFVPHPIWYITDTANALHGVFIFVIFVFKKKVYQQVFQRIRHPLKSIKQLSNSQTTTNKISDDSSGKGKTQVEAVGVVVPSAKDSNTWTRTNQINSDQKATKSN